jgi:hypothetical protein
MAYELWTSPVTGYRRMGTRVKEVRTLFDKDVTMRCIYEPLKACPADADAVEMAVLLEERGFDVAGVKEPDTDSITRFVTAASLKSGGNVRDHAVNIAIDNLIADATSLAKVFSILGSREYSFVVVDANVAGIITRADLNKPPARIYLFGLVSLLEMHLVFWIRKEFGDEAWKQHLKESRIEQALKLYEQRKQKHQELNLCECLQVCDKADVVMTHDELRDLFAINSKNEGRRLFGRAEDLRDLLAHGQTSLVEGTTWEDLTKAVAWIERALEASDAKIEKLANQAGANYVEKFWSASG